MGEMDEGRRSGHRLDDQTRAHPDRSRERAVRGRSPGASGESGPFGGERERHAVRPGCTAPPRRSRSADSGLDAALIHLAQAGGDTDTNAAVAGALLGARHGETALPPRWMDQLVGAQGIGKLAEELVNATM